MCGWIYSERAQARRAVAHASRVVASARRALYACHIALLAFLLTVVAGIARAHGQTAITDLSRFSQGPGDRADRRLRAGLQPAAARHPADVRRAARGDAVTAELCTAAKLVAYLRRQRRLVDAGPVRRRACAVSSDRRCDRARHAGDRNGRLLAPGLAIALDRRSLDGRAESRRCAAACAAPRWAVVPAIAIAVVCLAWRHITGQVPVPARQRACAQRAVRQMGAGSAAPGQFSPRCWCWFLRFGPWLARHVPLQFLARLGAASLPVFCAHLVICLLALAIVGDHYEHRNWIDRRGDGRRRLRRALRGRGIRRTRVPIPRRRRREYAPVNSRSVKSPTSTAHSRSRSGEARRA